MYRITKRWDRTDTFAFAFAAVCLFLATVLQFGFVLSVLFTVAALGFSFVLWLRT